MKRAFDFAASMIAVVILSPLLIAVYILVRYKLGSPALFAQVRPGLEGKPFKMFKFRSMTEAVDATGDRLPDAERITPFGRFLRSSSIDELPALYNVIKGEMSLVGPRPLLMEYLPLYSVQQRRRHEVRPGLSGWAQVNGRNAISWEEKFRLDVWYVDNANIFLDLKIIYRTIKKVLIKEGISADGEATMPKFTGSDS
ncbi:Sugar transferase involved in LPS biosynthesis (colanic, teichoic acid) [Pseudomonas gessardii]|uniref:sugar transferase n=1 Tax=Pseudomonas gessardii TaxID=78544 RepID=UPI0008920332|nr:sugar transferase [Pseudomonas gessardii]MRU53741.1 sugar transferase [Pseudomonas gessardii]ONH37903.1 sugar transferase [Pseudomonas gessardii]SDQ72670.1 Sugar transferase involved in LPS biosynthesis (colanic, teichoic acid) [Pseudomonas gessardii]